MTLCRVRGGFRLCGVDSAAAVRGTERATVYGLLCAQSEDHGGRAQAVRPCDRRPCDWRPCDWRPCGRLSGIRGASAFEPAQVSFEHPPNALVHVQAEIEPVQQLDRGKTVDQAAQPADRMDHIVFR